MPVIIMHGTPDSEENFHRQLRQLLTYAGLTVVGEARDIPTVEVLRAVKE
jgi:hypothetical protein